jgi:ribonuclease-3
MEPPEQPSATARPALDPAVQALEERLGVGLADPQVALAAVTHKSFVNEHRGEGLQDNERLEFLGDAVLDLAVSHRLMERFPDAREGELSKIRAAVVDEAGLARMARALELGPLLRLGRGEELTGGREKSSLLADAMEAVVAALYLGGGLAPVLALLDRFLGDAFARAAAGTLDRDWKTQLQELAQSRMRVSPRYRVVAEHGPDHSKIFDVELELRGEVVGRGAGRSKKDAEQAAAKLALETLTARLPAPQPAEPKPLVEEQAEPEPIAEAALPVEPAVDAVSPPAPAAQPEPAAPASKKPRAKRPPAKRPATKRAAPRRSAKAAPRRPARSRAKK